MALDLDRDVVLAGAHRRKRVRSGATSVAPNWQVAGEAGHGGLSLRLLTVSTRRCADRSSGRRC